MHQLNIVLCDIACVILQGSQYFWNCTSSQAPVPAAGAVPASPTTVYMGLYPYVQNLQSEFVLKKTC